ncbi:MAG: adenylate kinase [Oligoflexales bacterium]|nr:adenylate kinase [Oligoflexales bacterium]
MIFVLIGAPGAGKGTQADLLVESLGCYKISTGDALRRQISLGTKVGKEAEAFISEGKLVPDDVLLGILKEELASHSEEVVLLDGYPRNLSQANTLEELESVYPVNGAIHIHVDESELLGRLGGRCVCSNCGETYHMQHKAPSVEGVCDKCGGKVITRTDDQEDKIRVRLEVYENQTAPVLNYYQDRKLYYKIDGTKGPKDVFNEIKGIVEDLKGSR